MQCFTPQGTPVEILGAEKVHPKLGGMIDKMINLPNAEDDRPCEYHPLHRVMLTTKGYPVGKVGCFINDDITLNLQEIWGVATELAEEDNNSSVIGMAWHVLLRTMFHELFHVWVKSDYKLAFDSEELEDEHAEIFAEAQLTKFAATYDTEIPPWDQLGFFTEKVKAYLGEKATEGNEYWLERQTRMVKEGYVVLIDDVPVVEFRNYMKLIADKGTDEDMWNKPVLSSWHNVAENMPQEAVAQESVPAPPAAAANAATASAPPPPSPSTPSPPQPTPPAPTAVPPTPVAVEQNHEDDNLIFDMQEDAPPPSEGDEVYEYHRTENAYHVSEPIPKPKYAKNHNIPMEEMIASMQAIYMRLANNIFDKCQFNGAGAFGNPAGVLEGVSIADIPHANQLIHSCETMNQYGQKTRSENKGVIRGTVFTKSGLPAFVLWVNINGQMKKRLLVPQNPNKGSKSAEQAKSGARIVWIIDGDMTDQEVIERRKQGKRASKFIAKIMNGQYTVLN